MASLRLHLYVLPCICLHMTLAGSSPAVRHGHYLEVHTHTHMGRYGLPRWSHLLYFTSHYDRSCNIHFRTPMFICDEDVMMCLDLPEQTEQTLFTRAELKVFFHSPLNGHFTQITKKEKKQKERLSLFFSPFSLQIFVCFFILFSEGWK